MNERFVLSPSISLDKGDLELQYFLLLSIRMRASTAITCFSVANNGLISISLISVAKRSKVESRTIISANLSSFTPFCPRVPLIIL